MHTMARLLGLAVLPLLLACGGNVAHKRIYPPQASIQELQVLADGAWALRLRIENFSTVSTRIDRIKLGLTLAGVVAGDIDEAPALTINAELAEPLSLRFEPSAQARAVIESALRSRAGLRYRLQGRIDVGDPPGRYPNEYESVLSPVPGLDGIFR